jgi:hypothetical protein
MDDQIRLTYLTRYYYELQGLRTAPLWLFFVLTIPAAPYLNEPIGAAFPLIAVGLMGIFTWLGGRYYRRRFGWLNPAGNNFPKSRVYWSLYWGAGVCAICCIFSSHFFSSRFFELFPILFIIVWINPLFNTENPLVRRTYYALGGIVVAPSALFLLIAHWDGRIIIVIQCIVLLALCLADHLLMMSLCIPPRDNADA